jgi:cytochrome c
MRNIFIFLGLITLSSIAFAGAPPTAAGKTGEYATQVKPILEAGCYKCHGGTSHRGGLSMMTRVSLLKGGKHGSAIVPGDPTKSLMITLMKHEGTGEDPTPMPPAPRPKLTDAQIETVEHWIKAGALIP